MPAEYVPESGSARRTTTTKTALRNALSTLRSPSTLSTSTLNRQISSLTYNQLAGLRGATSPSTAASKLSSTRSGGGTSSGSNRSGYSYRTPTYGSSSSGRSGGSGSGGGASAPLGPVGWNPTGLAANYLESAADLFAKDPTLLLRDLVTQRYGQQGGETIFSQLAPAIDDANALYLMMQGQDAGQGTNAEWINWLGSFIDQQLTPGKFFNTDAALRNLFGAVPGSPLQGYLGTGDSLAQGENFSRLLNAALDVGFHPLIAEGVRNNVGIQRQAHAIASSKAAVNPFISFLQAQNPDLGRVIGIQ